jgi:hypothetical protein
MITVVRATRVRVRVRSAASYAVVPDCRRLTCTSSSCWFAAVCRAGRFAEDVLRTTNELESVVTIIVANDKQMPRRDPLRPYMAVSGG